MVLAPYPTLTQTPDIEGRPYSISDSAGNQLVTSTLYNPFGEPTTVAIGTPTHSDSYTYDGNTGRMTGFSFPASGGTYSGSLTWNANGTLGSSSITDPFNKPDTQSCTYSYDDVARLASANCGSAWSQTFSYPDQFGNISKSGSGNFQPT